MARICKCHAKVAAAMAAGQTFEEAYRKHGRPGYHEHRCECACGCKKDTVGYKYCAACHWSRQCLTRRSKPTPACSPSNTNESADE